MQTKIVQPNQRMDLYPAEAVPAAAVGGAAAAALEVVLYRCHWNMGAVATVRNQCRNSWATSAAAIVAQSLEWE